jgi:uncharacterized phage-associated protein
MEVPNMGKALEVARYLIHLAAAEEEPDFLTNMRLQKLLYYVQGWCLALHNKPMFEDRIEAWAHGPVVVTVYPKFAGYNDKPVDPEKTSQAKNLTKEQSSFIKRVWDAYKVYSTSSLRDMTHKEEPWLNARKGYGPADRCDEEITQEALKKYFKKLAA